MPRRPYILNAGMPSVMGRRDLPCATVDPDLFYSDAPTEQERAKRVCHRCPVQQACLRDALKLDLAFGIRGGYDPAERRAIARELARRRAGTPTPPPAAAAPDKPRPADRAWAWPQASKATDPYRMFDAAADVLAGCTTRDAATRWGVRLEKVQVAASIARWAPDLVDHVKAGLIRDTAAARYAEKVRDAHTAARQAAA